MDSIIVEEFTPRELFENKAMRDFVDDVEELIHMKDMGKMSDGLVVSHLRINIKKLNKELDRGIA